MMLCAIWYYLYDLKNVKNGGVLLVVKFKGEHLKSFKCWKLEACNFAKSNTPAWVFFHVFSFVQTAQNLAKRLIRKQTIKPGQSQVFRYDMFGMFSRIPSGFKDFLW